MSASQDSRKTGSDELPPQHHYVVISSDSHAGADLLDYKPYLESRWHDEFDAWAASYSNPWDFVDPRLERPDFDFGETEVLTGAASWHSALSWDSPRRLLHMDEDGVSAEVIFPNTAPPFLSGSDLEPLWQLCADLDMPVHKHAPAPPAKLPSVPEQSMSPVFL